MRSLFFGFLANAGLPSIPAVWGQAVAGPNGLIAASASFNEPNVTRVGYYTRSRGYGYGCCGGPRHYYRYRPSYGYNAPPPYYPAAPVYRHYAPPTYYPPPVVYYPPPIVHYQYAPVPPPSPYYDGSHPGYYRAYGW